MENKTIEAPIIITTKGLGIIKNKTKDFAEGRDIKIETADLNKALNGDTVRVRLGTIIDDQNISGQVVAVISRYRDQFVGTVKKENGSILVIPDSQKIHVDFLLRHEDIEKVTDNQKVLIKMEKWDDGVSTPVASLLKIFGQKGEHEVEMQSIIYEKGFQSDFPVQVEREAAELKKIWSPIPESEIAKRRDIRDETVFTIDPVDAKDFDDALSIKKLPNGNYEIGVHIADVSHYVTPGTSLDQESYNRAFSVYLVDRTIPMLPEILSNDLCSLNPNEEKLAFSTIFEMNENGDVLGRWFGKTIMKSKKRFTYEEAQAILDAESGPHIDELKKLNEIAKKLAKRKFEAGAILFEKEEIKFQLDPKTGRPIKIIKKERMDTHKLVEEFMLLSNREVAEYIFEQNKNFGGNPIGLMYRVHDLPDQEKIRDLSTFLKALGYKLQISGDGEVSAKDLNNLLLSVDGKVEEALIKNAAIKTMSKAIYSTQNTGHFGLAFDFYTHFTSPIRRYPDLLVHRILFSYINGKQIDEKVQEHLDKSATISTEREISAAEAERESVKYKQAEYMQDHIGEQFEGVISGVAKWGIYVMLNETLTEGMVHISKLGSDYFNLDEKNYAVIGQRTGKKFTLGDSIKIKIEKIDLEKKSIDMSIVEK